MAARQKWLLNTLFEDKPFYKFKTRKKERKKEILTVINVISIGITCYQLHLQADVSVEVLTEHCNATLSSENIVPGICRVYLVVIELTFLQQYLFGYHTTLF